MIDDIPKNWKNALNNYVGKYGWKHSINKINDFLLAESRANRDYHPQGKKIFAALKATPFNKVRVVIIGQDPYPCKRCATGIAFFSDGNLTKSLRNIYTAMGSDDIGDANLTNACLKRWAKKEYVLLLNSALTFCDDGDGNNTHKNVGWKEFIEAVVEALSNSERPIHFMLWGKEAKHFEDYINAPSCIDEPSCRLRKTNHPSQRNRRNLDVFLNCHHFSAVNTEIAGREGEDKKIKWIKEPAPPPE